MSRRKKDEPTSGVPALLDALPGNDSSGEYDPPVPADPPTFEQRLAALESQLRDSQQLVNKQAAVIVQAAENAEALKRSRAKVAQLEAAMNDAKAAATVAKKAYEVEVEKHFNLEDTLASGQQRLPFPPPEGDLAPPPAELIPPKPAEPKEDDSWRAVLLDTLDLPKTLIAKLFESNICTIGDITDFCKPTVTGFCRKLTDIAGIGDAKAEAIQDALDAFWTSRAMPAEEINQELLDGVSEIEAGRDDSADYADAADGESDEFAHPDDDDAS